MNDELRNLNPYFRSCPAAESLEESEEAFAEQRIDTAQDLYQREQSRWQKSTWDYSLGMLTNTGFCVFFGKLFTLELESESRKENVFRFHRRALAGYFCP